MPLAQYQGLPPGARGYMIGEGQAQEAGQRNLANLTKATQLQGALQKMQMEQQLKGILQQTGGDPAKAVQALIAAGTPQSIALAAKLKGMMPKPAEPYTLAPGAQRRGADNSIVAEAPQRLPTQQPSPVARLIAERDAIPQGDPRRNIYDQAITHATNPQQQRIIIPPQPHQPQWQDIADPLKPGSFIKVNPALFNEDKYKAGDRSGVLGGSKAPGLAERAVPAPIVKAYIENNTALSKLDRADAAVTAYPAAFGLHRLVGDTINQRVDPQGVDARAIISDIGSLKIHDRSGAAVTAAETPRLKPFIPKVDDTPETITKKLASFRKEYQQIQADIGAIYSKDQGYKELPASAAPVAPARQVKRTGTAPDGRKVIEYTDGTVETK